MNAMIHFFKRINVGRFLPVLWFSISLFISLLAGSLFFYYGVTDSLSSLIINMGIDPLRSQFIAALVVSAGVAFVGSALGQSRLGAIGGAGLVFYFHYLADFIQLQLKPVYDPGGHQKLLNTGCTLSSLSSAAFDLATLCYAPSIYRNAYPRDHFYHCFALNTSYHDAMAWDDSTRDIADSGYWLQRPLHYLSR